MKYAATTLCLAVLFAALQRGPAAADSEFDLCLKGAATQLALNRCAASYDLRMDRAMSAVYTKVLALTAKTSASRLKVTAAEDAWLVYRKSYMAAAFPMPRETYGSILPLQYGQTYGKVTEQHLIDLRTLVVLLGRCRGLAMPPC